jgi:low temperature requirement protein LtrA
MMTHVGRAGVLREWGAGAAEVTPVELFFDLVFAHAVTQLTHHLVGHPSPRGVIETTVLFLAVWSAWAHIAWTTSYFDLGNRPIRLALLGAMLTSLVMSASLPKALADHGLVFAAALATLLVGWTAFELAVIGRHHHLSPVFARLLIWVAVSGVLWLAGGLTHGDIRLALWLVAALLIYAVIWLGFPVPGLGRNHTTDYTISGAHLAHRCYLFVILALGESILVIGANFGPLPGSADAIVAFVAAFAGSAALWWIYFDRTEEAGLYVIDAASDPGRLGISAYTSFHIPMIAGIIAVAAADELTIAHPGGAATPATTALILGGPALYLAGNALFAWALWHRVLWSRLVAIGVLTAVVPLAFVATDRALMVTATLVLVGLAACDVRAKRGRLGTDQFPTG